MPAIAFEVAPPISTSAPCSRIRPFSARRSRGAACARKGPVRVSKKPGRFVVGADQTLALGQRLFSKPPSGAGGGAIARARRQEHENCHSAVAVARDGKILFAEAVIARMTMRQLSARK